jgi:hypothetical protein
MPTVQLDLLAKDGATAAIKGMTGSLLNANIAMAGLRMIANFAADSIGNAVKSNKEFKTVTDQMTVGVQGTAMALGSMLVGSLKDGLKAINDFIHSAHNIEMIGGSFALLINIGKQLIKDVFQALKTAMEPVTALFKDLGGEAGTTGGAINVLSVAMAVVSSVLKIVGADVKMVIQFFIDYVRIIVEATKTVATFFQFLAGKKNWDDVKTQFKETGEAIVTLSENLIKNGKALADTAKNEITGFVENTKKAIKENTKAFKDGGDESLKLFKENEDKLKAEQDKADKEKLDKQKAAQEKGIALAFAYGGALVDLSKQITQTIADAYNNMYASQLAGLDKWKEAHLAGVDEWIAQEEEKQGVREETTTARLEREISDLENSKKKKQSKEDRANTEKQIKEKQDELKRQQIADEGEKKRLLIEEDAKKKSTAIKKKQFEEQKTISTVNIWLNAATAVMGWWSSFASLGTAGIVLAAIMTVATLAMAGVQTGLVQSQTFQAAEGGVIPGTSMQGDKINVGINSMERVLTPEQNKAFEELVFNGKGGGMNIYGNITIMANNPNEFAEQLIELRRKEINR